MTSPSLAHSPRISSLMSKIAAGSSWKGVSSDPCVLAAIVITSSSLSVNMCFKMTTLSHRELVSGNVDGSSSSQSASLL